VLLSREAWALTGGAFDGAHRGAVAVKGFAEPVDVFEVSAA
jgi:class 3 adenylate cyclase